jgi:hypothetical protein
MMCNERSRLVAVDKVGEDGHTTWIIEVVRSGQGSKPARWRYLPLSDREYETYTDAIRAIEQEERGSQCQEES